jgi:hypothetical protein
VNGTGAEVAVKTKVCVADGFGGAVKFNVAALRFKVGGGGWIFSVTGIESGLAIPVTVTWTAAVYVPTAIPVGFTRTDRLAASLPDSGVAVSHKALAGLIEAAYAGVPAEARTETAWAAGSGAPFCQEKVSDAGVADAVWPATGFAAIQPKTSATRIVRGIPKSRIGLKRQRATKSG